MKPQVTGIAWYKEEQWEQLVSISEDSSNLAESYDAWRRGADKALQELADRGLKVYKVEVDVDEFVAWCKAKGMPIDGKARTGFVNHKLYQIFSQNEN